MKKFILVITFLFTGLNTYSQQYHTFPYTYWSNPITYQISPQPVITGYGELSESLSKEFHIETIYEYKGAYFKIESWADYYNWYTQKFWFLFENAEIYQYFYRANDDFGMASFVASQYRGVYYPSKISVSFVNSNKKVYNNRFKKNKAYAFNDKKINQLKKQLNKQSKLYSTETNKLKRSSYNSNKNSDYNGHVSSKTTDPNSTKSSNTSSQVNIGKSDYKGSGLVKSSSSSKSNSGNNASKTQSKTVPK